MYGFNGKIARVNLTTKEIGIKEPGEQFFRTYMGGSNLGVYYLLKELPPNIDPLSPQNKIVFSASVVTGAPVPGCCRTSIVAKSPLTEGIGDCQGGGFWGPELKFAGFDAVIVEGKAETPVYIWINNGKIQIRNATHIWGKETGLAQEIIRDELQDDRVRVMTIGPAGENLVRFACVVNDLTHVNGRTGMGAVMGSKNLKAIAVRGQKENLKLYDQEKTLSFAREFAQHFLESPDCAGLNAQGTSQYVLGQNAGGALPTKNFQTGVFAGAENISGATMHDTVWQKQEGCYACPVRCKMVVKAEKPWKVNPTYGGPEYETIASLGSNLGVDDLMAVIKANEIVNKNGLDSISTGMAIAFAMECFENGLITKKDTGGLDLTWGNGEVVVKLCEMIAARKGLGNLLAEGTRKAAQKIGPGAEKFALHVKGLEFPMHDPRAKGMLGFSYAFGPLGADHITCEHDVCFTPESPEYFLNHIRPLGLLEPLEIKSISHKKVRMFYYLQLVYSAFDCLDLCIFTMPPARYFTFNQVVELVNSITGWNTSLWEILKVGERRVNLMRLFNLREGIGKEQDVLPERMFETIPEGPLAGVKVNKEEFYQARDLYYEMLNWDNDGVPRKGKLVELNLADFINQ